MDPQQLLNVFEQADWQNLTVQDLRALAKAHDIPDIKGKNKTELQNSAAQFLKSCKFALARGWASPPPKQTERPPAKVNPQDKDDKAPSPAAAETSAPVASRQFPW